MKKPLIIIAGPTAVGKSDFAVKLAQRISGSIISADSMQVYRHMDIGSAKMTKEQMQEIPHYLIDEFHPNEEFNVTIFQEYAKKYLDEIYEQGRIPIIAGGTGFYIQSLLYDIDFTKEEGDTGYRKQLEEKSQDKGPEYLHHMLENVDKEAAAAIHPNNKKRLIRALEFYHQTGEKISSHNKTERQKTSPYQAVYFVVTDRREKLYQKIDLRVEKMLEMGLVQEVERLKAMGLKKEMVSMQGLGYKEILSYLNGDISLEEAVYTIKRDTRHFAKRQLTWFRREPDVIWIAKNEYGYEDDQILNKMISALINKEILV